VTTRREAKSDRYHPPGGHHHRDVSGGWLRPVVFGAMDGLVTNVSLIAGVGGAHVQRHFVILTGLAGLAAGAFSMAAGEYVSVSSQNELVGSEINKERLELQNNPLAEQRELAAMFRDRGVEASVAREVAEQISRNPDHALNVHVREELGVDPQELPSPLYAAAGSLVSFAVGAIIPLLPYLAGGSALWLPLVLAALAAIVGGGAVSRLTDRPFWRGAARQLILGAAAAALTFGIGHLVGGAVG
jgi:VIT1/CCC1 family predicted Fe2+/Mn2+ transporter